MAIVNNPHNVPDIEKHYKTWAKVVKQKGILMPYNGNLFAITTAYNAAEWLTMADSNPSENDPVTGKAATLKAKAAEKLIDTQFKRKTVDFSDTNRFKVVFNKVDNSEYFFQFHFYTVDELIKPSNIEGGLLYNNGLLEIRILDSNSPSANVLDTVKVTCNNNTSGFRENKRDDEVLPEKFVICYLNSLGASGIVESDRIYPMDALYYFVGFGYKGDFVNVASNSARYDSKTNDIGIPKFYSLVDNAVLDDNLTINDFTSTSLLKVPKDVGVATPAQAKYYFNDSTKQRNGLNVAAPGAPDLIKNVWFTAEEIPALKEFNLFSRFRLNTEFMVNIVGPFYYGGNAHKIISNSVETIDMNTIRFDNCKTVSNLFSGMGKLKTIQNFKFLAADKVESVKQMFWKCGSLETIDWSNVGTPPNCKDYSLCFSITSNSLERNVALKSVKLPVDFANNISKVEKFENVFLSNSQMHTIENLSLNMPKCTSMERLFANCSSLVNVNLSDIRPSTEEPVNISFMFYDCRGIQGELDLRNINKIGDMKYAFSTASGVTSIKFKKGVLDFRNNPVPANKQKDNIRAAFNDCYKLTKIENIEDIDAPEAIDVSELFSGLKSIESLSVPKLTLEKAANLSKTFGYQSKVKSISVPKATFGPHTQNLSYLFSFNNEMKTLDFPPLTKPNSPQNTTNLTNLSGLFMGCQKLTTPIYISNLNTSKVTTLYNTFRLGNTTADSEPAEIYGIEDMDVSKVTDFGQTFGLKLKNKTELNLTRWNVSNGTDFSNMFSSSRFSRFNLTGWNTSKAKKIDNMFSATMITSLDDIVGLGSLDFTNVENTPFYDRYMGGIQGLFSYNSNITRINSLPNSIKNIPKIISLQNFISGCTKLEFADLSGTNYGEIADISTIASSCIVLKTLDLTGMTLKPKFAALAFSNCYELKEIKGVIFDFSAVTNLKNIENMFMGCTKLTGVKVKNIPNNDIAAFEKATKLTSSQYTIVS